MILAVLKSDAAEFADVKNCHHSIA